MLARGELGLPGLRALGDGGHGYTPSTSTPMLRALPAMVRTAAARSAAVRSGVLVLAISSIWARVILPTLVVLGVPLPFSMPMALRISTEAGGVFMMNVKLRSEYTVITVGIGSPFSSFPVCALNCLQNSMMLTPCWPNAGPIGGDGLAAPAGTCSLIYACTFFAICQFLVGANAARLPSNA